MFHFGRFGLFCLGTSVLLIGLAMQVTRGESEDYHPLWVALIRHRQIDENAFPHFYEIILHHPQTGVERSLAHGDDYAYFARWSPDGNWLLYGTREYPSDVGSFSLLHVSGQPYFTEESFDANSTRRGMVSPDGQWEVYQSQFNSQLFLQTSDFRTTQPLTDPPIWRLGHVGWIWNRSGMWSADSQWFYFTGTTDPRYSYRDGTAGDLSIYRINPLSLELQTLVTIESNHITAFDIGEDWILFSNYNTLFRSRFDGADIQQLLTVSEEYVIEQFWSASNGDIILFTGDRDVKWVLAERINLEAGERVPLIRESGFAVIAINPSFTWSPDNQLISLVAGDGVSFRWIVMNRDGDIDLSFPAVSCVSFESFAPFWVEDTVYLVDGSRENYCRLLQYSLGDDQPTIVQEFPPDARHFNVFFTANHGWIQYELGEDSFVSNFDGSQSLELDLNIRSTETWVEIPSQTANSHLLIVVGMVCIGLTLISSQLLNRRSS